MADDLSSFFKALKKTELTSDERSASRTSLQHFMADHPVIAHSLQREIDQLALALPTSALSREEKRSISTALQDFIQRTPLEPLDHTAPTILPLFFGAWQEGNLLRYIRPFSLAAERR